MFTTINIEDFYEIYIKNEIAKRINHIVFLKTLKLNSQNLLLRGRRLNAFKICNL